MSAARGLPRQLSCRGAIIVRSNLPARILQAGAGTSQ